VGDEHHQLAELGRRELVEAEGGVELEADHVVLAAAHQQAEQQQALLPHRHRPLGPHLAEEVVDGELDEPVVRVAHVPSVDLLHHRLAAGAAPALAGGTFVAHAVSS
jgi:hypothetical protein